MFKKNDNQIKRQINYNTQSLINELINIMIKVSFIYIVINFIFLTVNRKQYLL